MTFYFNSQPHEEADGSRTRKLYTGIHFNSQPHEEADEFRTAMLFDPKHFNSQPHEEADGKLFWKQSDICISTHSLTKRLTATGSI